jgi:hypothetical protein
MSTGTIAPAPPVAAVDEEQSETRIRVYGHTNLFYWWPVWVVGFLLAGLTYVDGHVMAVVPAGTTVEKATPPGEPVRDALVVPSGQSLPPQPLAGDDQNPRLLVAANNNYGVVFVFTILLVVTVTNITVRGLASIIVIAAMLIGALVLAQLNMWNDIFRFFGGLDIRMNAGGYFAIAAPLCAIWLFAFFFYDRYSYIVVTHGQVLVRQAIGDGEIAVDTTSLMLEKRRNDFFRHWLLGFGAGDLHIKTGGAANLDFELNNVLFVGSKIERIQNKLREKEVKHEALTH